MPHVATKIMRRVPAPRRPSCASSGWPRRRCAASPAPRRWRTCWAPPATDDRASWRSSSPTCITGSTSATPTAARCSPRSVTRATAAAWAPYWATCARSEHWPRPRPPSRGPRPSETSPPSCCDTLDAADQLTLKQVRARCPHLDDVADHVSGFAEMMVGRHGDRLDAWISQVEADDQPDLHRFANGVRRDYDAVLNGLPLEYSTGTVEGSVNRIKMIKGRCTAAPGSRYSANEFSSPADRPAQPAPGGRGRDDHGMWARSPRLAPL